MNKNKNIFLVILTALAALPQMALAAIDWSIGASGNGWSVGIGSGNTGFGIGNTFGLPNGSIIGIIQNILFWLLAILGMVSVIGFVISGLLYLTAAGDEGQIDKAKRSMTYSIIGVIVGLSGFVVLQAVMYMLSGAAF